MSQASNLFCRHCDALLPLPSTSSGTRCRTCGANEPFIKGVVRRTTEKVADNLPDGALRRYGDLADVRREQDARATINERCPKCGHDTLRYTTAQLRSADEGTTVFYQCERCKYAIHNTATNRHSEKFTVTN